MLIVQKYGADALRLYLINSPVVRAENLRFKEEGVRDIIKDVFLPWFNAYRFLFQNVYRYVKDEPTANNQFQFDPIAVNEATNVMDIWIRSSLNSLIEFLAKEMKAYRLYTVLPRLARFIDQLTNWYVRLNRRRIKGEEGVKDCVASLNILFNVLYSMTTMMAPFTPYLSEYMYQRLVQLINKPENQALATAPLNKQTSVSAAAGKGKKSTATQTSSFEGGSVHLQMMPKSNRAYIKQDVELSVSRMQNVIELGRVLRDRKTMPIKYPVPSVIVIHKNEQYLEDIQSLEPFILGELNARELIVCADKAAYGVQLRADPDHKKLGLRLKGDFKAVMAAIKQLTDDQIQSSLEKGFFEILNHRVELDEVRVIYAMAETTNSKYEAHSDNDVLVLMDLAPTEELLHEGVAREIINRIQKLKKKTQLMPTDPVIVYYEINDNQSDLYKVAKSHQEFIEGVIKSPFLPYDAPKITKEASVRSFVNEDCDVKGIKMKITVSMEKQASTTVATKNNSNSTEPLCRWLNVVTKIPSRYNRSNSSNLGTVLIDDPNKTPLTLQQLRAEIELIFGLYRMNLYFTCNGKSVDLSSSNETAERFNGQTIFISNQPDYVEMDKKLLAAAKTPFVKFNNVIVDGKQCTILLENPKGNDV